MTANRCERCGELTTYLVCEGCFERVCLPAGYPGSKVQIMAKLWPQFPPHKHHCVLFGGMGGELVSKPQSRIETMCDRNWDNINAFRVLREETDRLLWHMSFVMYSVVEFCDARWRLRAGLGDRFARAADWWTVATQSNGTADPTFPRKLTWSFLSANCARGKHIRPKLTAVADRMRNVQLHCRDWEYMFDRLEGSSDKVLYTIDPPYLLETLSGGLTGKCPRVYTHTMNTEEEHRHLLRRIRRTRHKACVFHYFHPLYDYYLRNWRMIPIQKRVNMSPLKKAKPLVWECVWVNF